MGLEQYNIIYQGNLRIFVDMHNLQVWWVDNQSWSWSQWSAASKKPEHRCGTYIYCYDNVFFCPGCNKVVEFKEMDDRQVKVVDVE
jgi:hypothetical protein